MYGLRLLQLDVEFFIILMKSVQNRGDEKMKNRSFLYLFGLVVMILVVSLACSALSPTSTPEPASNSATEPLVSTSTDSSNPTSSNSASSGDLTTFTDQNNYYQIDLPSDWAHTQSKGDHYYIDTFKSPDSKAVVENIAYDDGTAFNGTDNGKFALQILNQNYSSTGKTGDIRVTDDSIQQDGSERLTWTSKAGGYSGLSYFEIRNKTTFLMFTVDWGNDSESTYIDTLDKVVSSYRLP
jgi:hypothetical protein